MTWQSRAVLLGLIAGTAACLIPLGSTTRSTGTLRMAVWGMPFEDRLFEDVYARGFEALQPGVSVTYGRYEDITDKYFAWHLLGQGPDVMRVRVTDYHAFVERGMLEPLDRFMDDPSIGLTPQERDDFLPAVWELLEIDGRRYALPSDNAQYGLYYNKALFDRAGLDYPSPDWTWGDLRAAAAALTIRGDDGRVEQYGIDFELWAWPFMAFLVQAGGRLWDEGQTTTLIDSPQGLEAVQLVVDLIPHTASMRAMSRIGSASGADKLFAGGQSAMLLDGSWRAPDLERSDPGLDYGIAPLPRHRRAAVVSGSVVWAVSVHSEHKELAWRMIKWMADREQSRLYWDALRVAPPARLSVIRSEAFKETRGLTDPDGTVWTHPMSRDLFGDRAAWLLAGVTPDPETDLAPIFVPVGAYQKDLEESIEAMLKRAVSPARTESLQELLDRAAEAVHQIIDRDRRVGGLPPVER